MKVWIHQLKGDKKNNLDKLDTCNKHKTEFTKDLVDLLSGTFPDILNYFILNSRLLIATDMKAYKNSLCKIYQNKGFRKPVFCRIRKEAQ